MTRHKQLSTSLSIAAIAIFAAAAQCFAQAQSGESRVETSTPATLAVAAPVLALNRGRATAEPLFGFRNIMPKSMSAVSTSANRPTLSVAMFMFKQPSSQFSNFLGQRFTESPTTIHDNVVDSKKQFRVDDDFEPAPRPRATFVPSRGQKLPA